MTRHLSRKRVAVLVTSAAVAAGVATALSWPAAAQPAAQTKPLTANTVTLLSGDKVVLTGDGYRMLPGAHGSGAAIRYRSADGHRHFVPAGLARYLGRGLDPALFDVDALAEAERGGRMPVRLSFAEGSEPIAPPGVEVTSVEGDTATGFVASGPAFTAALRRGPDHAVAGLRSVTLPDATPAPVVQPRYPLHTLEIHATDLTGAPADAAVFLINTDSVAKQNSVVPIVGGVGKVAVPEGNYTAFTDFIDLGSDGRPVAGRLVAPDVEVTSAPVTTLAVDERAATSEVTVSTPKPAVQQFLGVNIRRGDATGATSFLGYGIFGTGFPFYLAPRAKPAVGTLHTLTEWHGAPQDPAQGYRYDVAFNSDNGFAADQRHAVRADELATVHARFFADPADTSEPYVMYSVIDSSNVGDERHDAFGVSVPAAGTETEYLGTAHGGRWIQQGYVGPAMLDGGLRTFRAGHEYTVDWGKAPRVATAGAHTGAKHCIACSAGDTLTIGFDPVGDSRHGGDLGNPVPASHFAVSRNGTTLYEADGEYGAVLPHVPAGHAVYRATYDLDLSGVEGVSQSTVTHTDVTVPFDPATATELPAVDSCDGESAATPCRIVPMLSLRYDLATDLHNTSTAPLQVLRLTVGHLSYDGVGSRSRITSAVVSVSFDGGKTWRKAPVHGFAGHYVATWPNSAAAGTKPAIKVTATDADGGVITQTVTDAYSIGGSA